MTWPVPDAATRLSWVTNQLDTVASRPFSSNPTIRSYTFTALYLLAIKANPTANDVATAKSYIQSAFADQCIDATTCGSNYGLFRFHHTDTVYDYNSTTFTLQGLAPILAREMSQFSSTEIAAMRPNIDAALSAIDSTGPGTSYTNIDLMRATDLIIIGESLLPLDSSYQHYIDDGYNLISTWQTFTTTNGISEFDCPTYYAVDLDSLVLGYLDAHQTAPFQSLLDYFWADIAANYFPANGTLSGPHARDYEFLSGDGVIEYYFYLAGWRTPQPADTTAYDPEIERVFNAYNMVYGGYEPSTSACSMAFQEPKWVTQTWGTSPGQERGNYVGANFALGGASKDYVSTPQEKVISLEMSGATDGVELVVEDDQTQDNPYGARVQQGLFDKPFELGSFPVVAQQDGTLLVTSYATPLSSNASPTMLISNVLLPEEATIRRNGTVVDPNGGDVTLALNDVIGLSIGNSDAAIRIFRALDCTGASLAPVLRFERTDASGPINLARIAMYHQSSGSAAGCVAPVGMVVAAQDCSAQSCTVESDLANATVTDTFGSDWSASVQMGSTTLSLERVDSFSGTTTHTITSRTANGQAITSTPLELNGQNIAPPL